MKEDDIDKHVMVKFGKQFGELCSPIFKATSINYIGLARVYDDGSRSYLISNPKWGEILLNNQYHLAGTEDGLIQVAESGHQLWSASAMFNLNQETENLFKDCVANNYGNGATLFERGENFVEFTHICANSGYEKIDPFLEKNIDSLWNYILFIREALAKDKELKNAYAIKYGYPLVLPNINASNEQNMNLNIKKYYLGGNFGDIYFTVKEMDCLFLLYQNLTIKEIAKILNLSPRTVEFYIQNIKEKISCSSQKEIIIKLSNNYLFKMMAKNKIFPKEKNKQIVTDDTL